MSHLVSKSNYVRLQDHNGANITDLPVSHSALTELGSALNSNKMDVNLTNASVAVTNSVLDSMAVENTDQLKVSLQNASVAVTNAVIDAMAVENTDQLKVSVKNASLAVTNSNLDGLAFLNTDELKVNVANSITTSPTTPVQASAWSAVSVSSGNNSASADLQYVSNCSAIVNVSDTSSFKIQYSNNDSNWYDSPHSISLTGASTGSMDFKCGARYARLSCTSGTSITTTALICGKQ